MANDHGLANRGRDFGMAADEQDIEVFERLAHVLEHAGDIGFLRTDRQEEYGQEPTRPHAQHRNIVGVDQHRVATDFFPGQRDRIGRRHQRTAADADHAGVLADRRRQQQFRRILAERREQAPQQFGGKFAGWQNGIGHGLVLSLVAIETNANSMRPNREP